MRWGLEGCLFYFEQWVISQRELCISICNIKNYTSDKLCKKTSTNSMRSRFYVDRKTPSKCYIRFMHNWFSRWRRPNSSLPLLKRRRRLLCFFFFFCYKLGQNRAKKYKTLSTQGGLIILGKAIPTGSSIRTCLMISEGRDKEWNPNGVYKVIIINLFIKLIQFFKIW